MRENLQLGNVRISLFLLKRLSCWGEGRRGTFRVVGVAALDSSMDSLNLQPQEQWILDIEV